MISLFNVLGVVGCPVGRSVWIDYYVGFIGLLAATVLFSFWTLFIVRMVRGTIAKSRGFWLVVFTLVTVFWIASHFWTWMVSVGPGYAGVAAGGIGFVVSPTPPGLLGFDPEPELPLDIPLLPRYEETMPGVTVVFFPLWILVALALIPTAFKLWAERHFVRGICRSCGYDLRASKTLCPECGTAIVPDPPLVAGPSPFPGPTAGVSVRLPW